MMEDVLSAGAAEMVITPPLGLAMGGWANRAAGHNRACSVHDDLCVKCLVMRRGGCAFALVSADLLAVDAETAGRIRNGIAARTNLKPNAILVCATHCHSAPPICATAITCSPEERRANAVQSDGSCDYSLKNSATPKCAAAYYVDEIDPAWQESVIAISIKTGIRAWRTLRPAEVAFAETSVDGVASSRRVRLKNDRWADPRTGVPEPDEIDSRTEIDPMVRTMLVRNAETGHPLAALINYGTHPWVFSGDAISAEIAGAACRKVAETWRAPDGTQPVVLFATGPEGDVTTIWNIDVVNVWRVRPAETFEESLHRRMRGFTLELDRLSERLAGPVNAAILSATEWNREPVLEFCRREVLLPLKDGYEIPPEIPRASWQQGAPASHSKTEIQLMRVGDAAILSLPGEPFCAIGRTIRENIPANPLLIAAIANDFPLVGYIANEESWDMGGYEIDAFPLARGAAEILVEEAIDLLQGVLC